MPSTDLFEFDLNSAEFTNIREYIDAYVTARAEYAARMEQESNIILGRDEYLDTLLDDIQSSTQKLDPNYEY